MMFQFYSYFMVLSNLGVELDLMNSEELVKPSRVS